jgi:hypothetical protein
LEAIYAWIKNGVGNIKSQHLPREKIQQETTSSASAGVFVPIKFRKQKPGFCVISQKKNGNL